MSARALSPLLSFLIPTYNRAPQLARVLQNIEDELARSRLAGPLDVLVSDNASTDSTPQVLASFRPANFRLLCFRQEENLGMDRNMQFLYEHASSDYIWFFSDDDTLLPGSVARVLEVLRSHSPDVLIGSYPEAQDVLDRPRGASSSVEVIEEPAKAVELLAHHCWISIHVLRRLALNAEEKRVLEPCLGTNWWFVPLSYSILQRSSRPRLCVVHEPLAVWDHHRLVRFPPETWRAYWKIFIHPFATQHAPRLLRDNKRLSYYYLISVLFQVKAGSMLVENLPAYDKAIGSLEFRPAWLLVKPKVFLSFLLLKLSPRWIPAVAAWRARRRNRGASFEASK